MGTDHSGTALFIPLAVLCCCLSGTQKFLHGTQGCCLFALSYGGQTLEHAQLIAQVRKLGRVFYLLTLSSKADSQVPGIR